MAIWLTTDRTQPGPVFGNKGLSARIYAQMASHPFHIPSARSCRQVRGLGSVYRYVSADLLAKAFDLVDIRLLTSYANSRHTYGFPRIVGMLGDGKTAYDHDSDGDANSIGSCSVWYPFLSTPGQPILSNFEWTGRRWSDART